MSDDSVESDELRRFKAWFKADREHSTKWRKDAEEDFAFLAGEQWTAAEKAALKEQLRPAITFNRTHPIINSIAGMEIVNRQEVKYFPREAGDAKANELLTEGAKWFRDQADADDTDSDAFIDAATCGMGWTETTLDMEETEEGEPTMESVNPLEMYWDKSARQKNVADAERLWRARSIPLYRAKEMFPNADASELDAKWAKADLASSDDDDETQEEARRYEGDDENVERDQENVTIVHLQYKKRETYFLVANQMGGPSSEVSKADLAMLQERANAIGMPIAVTKKTRMVVQNVFIGTTVLQSGPALCKSHFSWQCVTAYKEHKTGTFYGLMRLMKDPQRFANKAMSQIMQILTANSKGGLLVEKSAVENVRDFEKNWSRADKVQWVEDGAISGGRIKEKQPFPMPAGFFQMMEFAIQSVRDVTGVSVELLGMREATQAASLEQQRKQAGMTIIAPLFDNLKRYRRDHGKLMLYIIQNYLADGRLVRIVGKEGAQYVPLALQADAKYDIVIDDQPNSPDQKMQVWQGLVQIFPLLPPQVQLALVDYAPLPTSVIEKIKEAAGNMQQNQIPPELQQELAKLTDENKQLKVGAETDMAKVQASSQAALMKVAADEAAAREKIASEERIAAEKIAAEARIAMYQAQIEANSGNPAAAAEAVREQQKHELEMESGALDVVLLRTKIAQAQAQAVAAANQANMPVPGNEQKGGADDVRPILDEIRTLAATLARPKTVTTPDGRKYTMAAQ